MMDSQDEQAKMETPRQAGYRWPAEWEPHAATWVTWPHNPDTWPGRLPQAQREFAEFVRTLARFEPVHVLLSNDQVRQQANETLRGVSHVTTHDWPTNDSWIRDYGPTFLLHSEDRHLALVDWRYNAWGGKYPPWQQDDAIAARVALHCDCTRFVTQRIMEGGAIEGNGRALVLTTEDCLLNPNRNPTATRQDMEQLLADHLSADAICWLLGQGIEGDDTDGHVDQLARFVGPTTVLAAIASDPADPQFAPLAENVRRLQAFGADSGRPLEVIGLPLPSPKYCQQQRLPASYCNFYIANGAVLVPQFDDPADGRACGILSELMPGREVLGVPALDLVWGLGAFHCLTQQEPLAG
jgi:agmatine deiminase